MYRVAVGLAILLLSGASAAIEPIQVIARGDVEVGPEEIGAGRALAINAAMVEAALEVARMQAPVEQIAAAEERIREVFADRAAGFVLTYRVEGSEGPWPSLEDPEKQRFAVRLSANIDASLVRETLEALGVLRTGPERPSVLLRVIRDAAQPGDPRAPLESLHHFVARRLERLDWIVVDPALRGSGIPEGLVLRDFGRRLGADLALELAVRWQARPAPPGMTGGAAEVRVRALRVQDGIELARSRFEGLAYHQDPDEAFARALEGVRDQVVENLILQIGRNWQALAGGDGPIQLRLVRVSSLREVEAVRRALEERLGAERSTLISLAPSIAEIAVRGRLSPGALQDRLVALTFEDFSLHPMTVSQRQVELRVESSLRDGPEQPDDGGRGRAGAP